MIPARIVAFGSSSVYGRGDPVGGGFVGRLRSWHEPRNSLNLVYNLGVGGDTVKGMLLRFEDEVSIRRPDFIILYPGLNDIRRTGSRAAPPATSPERFRSDLSALLDISTSIAPTLMVSSFPIDETRTTPWKGVPQQKLYYLTEEAKVFTEIGRVLCDEKKILYLPVFETWSTRRDCNALSLDGLHGTPEAHVKLFEEIKIFLCDRFE